MIQDSNQRAGISGVTPKARRVEIPEMMAVIIPVSSKGVRIAEYLAGSFFKGNAPYSEQEVISSQGVPVKA